MSKSHVLKLKFLSLPQRTLCQASVQNIFTLFMHSCNKTGNLVFHPKLYLEIGTYTAKFG